MTKWYRLKNKFNARLANRFPAVANRLIASFQPMESTDIPWAPVKKQLHESQIAIVTTTGIHHEYQTPFNMYDPMGDSTYRIVETATIEDDYMITHDYYDHRDADRDLNIIFPITRLKEMAAAGIIGGVAAQHFSFMGHIMAINLDILIKATAPEVAAAIRQNQVDAVILTPG